MNKKNLLCLLAIMIVAIVSVSFVSCSRGGDEEEGPAKISIVGTWKWEKGKESLVLTFQSDGSGRWQENNYGRVKAYGFSYTINYDEMKLSMKFPDGDVETKEIKDLTATTVTIDRKEFIRM